MRARISTGSDTRTSAFLGSQMGNRSHISENILGTPITRSCVSLKNRGKCSPWVDISGIAL